MVATLGLSAAVIACFATCAPALAQPSDRAVPASNITAANMRSAVAPPLPVPPVPSYAQPAVFLHAARSALLPGHTGETQEALERAETRLLDRAVDRARANSPDAQRAVLDIGVARQALATGDRAGAARAIDDAILAASQPPPAAPVALAQPVVIAPSPPPFGPPPMTYALLPGHWQLRGARYVWVPPETRLRQVEERPFVMGHYAWRNGAWVWVAAHYAAW